MGCYRDVFVFGCLGMHNGEPSGFQFFQKAETRGRSDSSAKWAIDKKLLFGVRMYSTLRG